MTTRTKQEDSTIADKIQIKRDGKTSLYIATYRDITLWIHRNHALGEWGILKPYAFKKPDGTYRSKRLGSYGCLYKAKEAVIRILKKKRFVINGMGGKFCLDCFNKKMMEA